MWYSKSIHHVESRIGSVVNREDYCRGITHYLCILFRYELSYRELVDRYPHSNGMVTRFLSDAVFSGIQGRKYCNVSYRKHENESSVLMRSDEKLVTQKSYEYEC